MKESRRTSIILVEGHERKRRTGRPRRR